MYQRLMLFIYGCFLIKIKSHFFVIYIKLFMGGQMMIIHITDLAKSIMTTEHHNWY